MKTTNALLALASLAVTTSGCAHRQWAQALEGERSIEVRPGDGVGNLTLGMGQGRVKRRLGEPGAIDRFGEGETYWTYPQLGVSVKFVSDKLDSVFCYSGIKGGYETRTYQPFTGATTEGVGVHANQRQVLEAYGRPATREKDPRAPIPATWLTYTQGLGFCFVASTDQMIYLYVD